VSNNPDSVPPDRHDDYRRQATQHFGGPAPGHTVPVEGRGDSRPPAALQFTTDMRLGSSAAWTPTQRANVWRDAVAAAMLLIALLLPWNVYFGTGVPDSDDGVFMLLISVTVLSWSALAATYLGERGAFGVRFDANRLAKIRVGLNTPYLLLVAGFIAFTLVQAVRYGGSGQVPPGFGPGGWFGVAGSLLAAQPTLADTAADDARFTGWYRVVRIIGMASIVAATVSVLFNLYWRTRYVLPGVTDATHGAQNVSVVATTVVYGAVALTALVVASRWLLQAEPSARLATTVLGASTMTAGLIVWTTEIGRDIDAFHGIAQNTSTAAIGFEGYAAWVAAAAIVGPPTLMRLVTSRPFDNASWRDAARKCLVLIAVWCVGSALLRIFDVITTLTLSLPISPYDSIALLAFDVVAAAVAVWLRVNLTNTSAPPALISAVSGVLFVLTICRVAVGVGLAPRIQYVDSPADQNAVYGNMLAHQITSTFDVVLCGLALAVLAVAIVVIHLRELRLKAEAAAAASAAAHTAAADRSPADIEPDDAPSGWTPSANTAVAAKPIAPRIYRRDDSATGPSTAAGVHQSTDLPRIFRPSDDGAADIKIAASQPETTHQLPASAAHLLEESSQRFAAGTTYTGSGPRRPTGSPPPTDT
jgi:hypothetical protein